MCDGVCLPPGQCCSDADCAPGLRCLGNVCVCQSLTSCATAGLNCGTFTDDCGAIHDCGSCTAPQTCGGSGTAGICGCVSSITCEGRCGSVLSECGTLLECGNTCGACEICSENTCTVAGNGTPCNPTACIQGAICIDGRCSGGFAVTCPADVADRCNRNECDPTLGCVKTPINENGSCADDPCHPGRCRAGVCEDTDKECPICQGCSNGECVPSNDGGACGEGLHCYAGNCCNMPTIDGVVPDDDDILMTCVDTDSICCAASAGPCCPGTTECCEMCVTIEGDGGRPPYNKCCLPEQQCGGTCCWDTDTCINNRCVNSHQVCDGNVVCGDECCGRTGDGTGTCCGENAYCVSGACLPRQNVSCTDHLTCETLYDPGAVCANMSINSGTGQVTPGTCCPGGYSSINTSGPNAGQYSCCAPETRPSQTGCCAYPDYDCPSCTCSTTQVRRWGR